MKALGKMKNIHLAEKAPCFTLCLKPLSKAIVRNWESTRFHVVPQAIIEETCQDERKLETYFFCYCIAFVRNWERTLIRVVSQAIIESTWEVERKLKELGEHPVSFYTYWKYLGR